VFDSHPIDARATLVTANSFPRSFEISSVAHLLHQLFYTGRAFGYRLRHKRFGPLVTANRGFTPVFWCQGQRVLELLPLSICGRPLSGKGKRWDRCCAWSDAVICPAFDAAG